MDELPVLAGSAKRHAGKVRFLGISWDRFGGERHGADTLSTVAETASSAGVPYGTLVFTGEPEDLFEGLSLEARSIPQTFVYDASGKEVARFGEEVEAAALEEAIGRAKRAPSR